MTYPKALFLGMLSIAIAIVIAAFATDVTAQSSGRYTIASDGGAFVWRVDMATGSMSYCLRDNNSLDPRLIARRPPYCSGESGKAGQAVGRR